MRKVDDALAAMEVEIATGKLPAETADRGRKVIARLRRIQDPQARQLAFESMYMEGSVGPVDNKVDNSAQKPQE